MASEPFPPHHGTREEVRRSDLDNLRTHVSALQEDLSRVHLHSHRCAQSCQRFIERGIEAWNLIAQGREHTQKAPDPQTLPASSPPWLQAQPTPPHHGTREEVRRLDLDNLRIRVSTLQEDLGKIQLHSHRCAQSCQRAIECSIEA